MLTKIKNNLVYIALVIGLIIGFFAGRATIKTVPEIQYVAGETIHDSIPVPTPYFVQVPSIPVLPMKPDTIRKNDTVYFTQKVDTAAIIADYIVKRDYKIDLFKDKEKGELKVFPSVQYNKLLSLEYEYTPVTKIQTVEKKRIFTPFAGIGFSTNDFYNVGGGLFYHNAGLEYRYNFNLTDKQNFHTINLNVKF
ncbi:MAG TPA: hypothetical protein PK285_12035 [Bacteroidales bacterium]|nr:hypothetical protein [Bacteroidales bacterium]